MADAVHTTRGPFPLAWESLSLDSRLATSNEDLAQPQFSATIFVPKVAEDVAYIVVVIVRPLLKASLSHFTFIIRIFKDTLHSEDLHDTLEWPCFWSAFDSPYFSMHGPFVNTYIGNSLQCLGVPLYSPSNVRLFGLMC